MASAMRLSIESLRAFREVVRRESITRAAHHLHLTQSAVSWKLRRLEDHLGRSLLDRSGRRIRPTADGRVLLAHAERILDAHDAAAAHFGGASLHGRLAFGATESVSTEGLSPLLGRLTRIHPGLDVTVRIDQSPAIEEALDAGGLDLGVVKVAAGQQRSTDRVLWHDQLLWVGTDTAPTGLIDPIPYISFGPKCFFHPIASEALARAGYRFRTVLEAPAISSARAAVAAGIGIAIFDRYMLQDGAIPLPELNDAAPLPEISYVLRFGLSVDRSIANIVGEAIVAELAPDCRNVS